MLLEFYCRYSSIRHEICTRNESLGDIELETPWGHKKAEDYLNGEIIKILLPGGMRFGRMYGEVIMLDGTYNTKALKYP